MSSFEEAKQALMRETSPGATCSTTCPGDLKILSENPEDAGVPDIMSLAVKKTAFARLADLPFRRYFGLAKAAQIAAANARSPNRSRRGRGQ